MRIWFIVVALLVSAAGMAALLIPAGVQARPAAVQLAQGESSGPDYVGVYHADLPAADSPGRSVTLTLAADGTAQIISDYQNGEPPIVEVGAWTPNADGGVRVAITGQTTRTYDTPVEYQAMLDISTDEMVLTDADGRETRYARVETAGDASDALIDVEAAAPVADPENTYVGIRPSASGGAVETIALTLDEGGSVTMTSNYHNDEPPIVEIGSWQGPRGLPGDGTITVTLSGRVDADYEAPVVITFQQEGDDLQSVGAEERYGANGLHLRRAAAVARDLSRSLFTIDLAAGFALDPTFLSVNGGGEVDASLLGGQCRGFIHRQPVVTVNWSGETDFVRAFFVSDSDPTLVVATPDGNVLCSDDAHSLLLDPTIEITNPVTGAYRIWVGSVAQNQLIPGVLVLTTKPDVHLGTFDMDALIQRPLLPHTPVTVNTRSNITNVIAAIEAMQAEAAEVTPASVAVTAVITAEGTIAPFQMNLENPQCIGLVNARPDFVFVWPGGGDQLRIYFEGDADAALLVLSTAGGTPACNDDIEPDVNLNPLVVLQQPPAGIYGVWVARIDPTQPVSGTLTVTSVGDAGPAVLPPAEQE
jgi:uncharacterized lipoprotein NlpE involved in copper resistance